MRLSLSKSKDAPLEVEIHQLRDLIQSQARELDSQRSTLRKAIGERQREIERLRNMKSVCLDFGFSIMAARRSCSTGERFSWRPAGADVLRRRYDAAFSVLLLMRREHCALILPLEPNWRVYPRVLIWASRQSRPCPGRQQKSPNDRRVR